MSNSKSGREDHLISILSVYTEDDFARIYHVELASCNTLDIGVVFAELLLSLDLTELESVASFSLRDSDCAIRELFSALRRARCSMMLEKRVMQRIATTTTPMQSNALTKDMPCVL